MHGLMLQAAKQGVKRIRLHLLTDGRDCEDGSSIKLMTQLVKDCKEVSQGGVDAQVASGGGRMRVTMDRYEVWGPVYVWDYGCLWLWLWLGI